MKRRVLSLATAVLMTVALVPIGTGLTAQAADYTATIEGELDESVSTVVAAWGLGEEPGASIDVTIGEEATISMEFAEPIKFTGNWTGITIDIPVESDVHAGTSGAKILSFIVDGNDLGSKIVPIINRDGNGSLCIGNLRKPAISQQTLRL